MLPRPSGTLWIAVRPFLHPEARKGPSGLEAQQSASVSTRFASPWSSRVVSDGSKDRLIGDSSDRLVPASTVRCYWKQTWLAMAWCCASSAFKPTPVDQVQRYRCLTQHINFHPNIAQIVGNILRTVTNSKSGCARSPSENNRRSSFDRASVAIDSGTLCGYSSKSGTAIFSMPSLMGVSVLANGSAIVLIIAMRDQAG